MELMKFINFKGALTIETVMFYISEFFFLQRRENRVHSRPQIKNNWNLFEALKLGQVSLHASLVNIRCFFIVVDRCNLWKIVKPKQNITKQKSEPKMVSVAMKNTQLLQICFFFLKDGYAYLNAFFA